MTINIGGGQNQTTTAGPPPTPPGMFSSWYQQQYPSAVGQPATGPVAGSTALPASLQQYAPPTTDFVHQLWGKELSSGAVQSPFASMTPQVPVPVA